MDNQEKYEKQKEKLIKIIKKIYLTTSLNVESQASSDLEDIANDFGKQNLIDFANSSDVFTKCVLHYKLPIDYKLDWEFSDATKVSYDERIKFWKEYKNSIKNFKFAKEEEFNKIILMACILHVPIKDDPSITDDNIVDIEEKKQKSTIDTIENIMNGETEEIELPVQNINSIDINDIGSF